MRGDCRAQLMNFRTRKSSRAATLAEDVPSAVHRSWSIRFKLSVAVNVVLLGGMVVLMVLDFQRGLAERLGSKRVSMSEEAALVLSAVDALEHHGVDAVQDYIDRACAQMQDAASPGHHIAVRLDEHTFLQARTHDRASAAFAHAMQLASSAVDHRARVEGEPILVGSRRRDDLVVYVSEFTNNIRQAARAQLIARAEGIALVGIALTAMVNLVLLRVVTRPIGRLAATVRRIGRGEWDAMPPRSTTSELDDLALEIGAMSRSLAKADEYRRHQMAKARRIQHHLMPRADHLQSVGIHHVHLPADDVGGDFFDVKIIDDHRVAIYMGDVTGHGVPAAMSAGMLKTLFEHGDAEIANPAAVLQQINRRFHAVTLDGDFATMFMGVIDRRKSRLIYASAGHEIGYVLRQHGGIDELNTTGLLLGVDPDANCEMAELAIGPGDTIVLLTDGLIETMSPHGKPLGRQAVVAALAADKGAAPQQESPHDLAARLLHLADAHRDAGPQLDDITLAILRV